MESSRTLIDVLLRTGLVFFGTPHAGGDDRLVALGSAAARIAKSIHLQTSSDIIETLKKGSLFTDLLEEHWRQQLESYQIVSFWEGIGDVSHLFQQERFASRLSSSPTFQNALSMTPEPRRSGTAIPD